METPSTKHLISKAGLQTNFLFAINCLQLLESKERTLQLKSIKWIFFMLIGHKVHFAHVNPTEWEGALKNI